MERDVVWVEFDTMERFAADRRGIYSHGVNRMKPIYYDRIKAGIQHPVTNFEIVREGPTTAVVDGHDGMGQVIARRSISLAIIAAGADMIGTTGTNARPSVAPTFGIEAMLGTNPPTFGMPTGEPFPFVLDCATSISQRGKIEACAKIGKELPCCWGIGKDGGGESDPDRVPKGFDFRFP